MHLKLRAKMQKIRGMSQFGVSITRPGACIYTISHSAPAASKTEIESFPTRDTYHFHQIYYRKCKTIKFVIFAFVSNYIYHLMQ